MTRLPDWQLRWEALVLRRLTAPMVWGEHDCGLWMCEAVEALTGVVVCPDLRWHRNAREALRILASVGGPRGVATRALGEPVRPALARIGDIVTVPIGKRECLAVCNGQTVIGPTRAGLAEVARGFASAAWRVG